MQGFTVLPDDAIATQLTALSSCTRSQSRVLPGLQTSSKLNSVHVDIVLAWLGGSFWLGRGFITVNINHNTTWLGINHMLCTLETIIVILQYKVIHLNNKVIQKLFLLHVHKLCMLLFQNKLMFCSVQRKWPGSESTPMTPCFQMSSPTNWARLLNTFNI